MNAAQKAVASTKKFVSDHKVAIAVVTTATVTTAAMIKLNKSAVQEWNDFLEKHNLTEQFYNPGE